MITILSRRLLPQQHEKYVYVQRDDAMYMRVGDEYIIKRYFTIRDVIDASGKKEHEIRQQIRKLGITAPIDKRKKIGITLQQLREIL